MYTGNILTYVIVMHFLWFYRYR